MGFIRLEYYKENSTVKEMTININSICYFTEIRYDITTDSYSELVLVNNDKLNITGESFFKLNNALNIR